MWFLYFFVLFFVLVKVKSWLYTYTDGKLGVSLQLFEAIHVSFVWILVEQNHFRFCRTVTLQTSCIRVVWQKLYRPSRHPLPSEKNVGDWTRMFKSILMTYRVLIGCYLLLNFAGKVRVRQWYFFLKLKNASSLNKGNHERDGDGYLIVICMDFTVFFSVFSLVLVFGLISKHLIVREKYSATRRIFNSLLDVWKSGQTRSVVFDILPLSHPIKPLVDVGYAWLIIFRSRSPGNISTIWIHNGNKRHETAVWKW